MLSSIYSVSSIASIIDAFKSHIKESEQAIQYLIIDSRKVNFPDKSLFFAIKGERNNGHDYINDLYQKGVRNFVVSEKELNLTLFPEASFLFVENTLQALQKLAAHHRKQFSIPVIGITGSNGKTVVKEWLFQLLREDKNIVRSPKSFNSQVGVPLSVWELKSDNDLAIFEAGISRPNEMLELEKIIQPTIGLFTNIGQAHAENFDTLIQKVNEKLLLFKNVETLIYCKDYLSICDSIKQQDVFLNKKIFSWSKRSKADLQIGRVNKADGATNIQGIYNNSFIDITVPFSDEASIENCIHCWAILLFLGYKNEDISPRFKLLTPIAMRLELKEGINNCSVINDCYNSDFGSLQIALDFLNQQKQHPNKTLILSDILQTGKSEEELYSEVAQLVAQSGVQKVIGIGESISRQKNKFAKNTEFYATTEQFLAEVNTSLFKDETILIKGARSFGFERISKYIQQKAHETVLEINLNSLVSNLNYYRSLLQPKVKVMAMVKAFSYGSGSFEIANVLQFNRIDYLAVAYADEGVELRMAGIKTPIMVMNPEEQSYNSIVKWDLEPEIYNFRILSFFSDTLLKSTANAGTINVHIKLDTGMHRLGFDEHEINELIVRIKNNKKIKIKSVFSHLVASDEAEHNDFTKQQIQRFKAMSDLILSHFDYPIIRHISNSGGISKFPEAQFDMVRLGIGMYGVASRDYEQVNLQNVATLKTIISQIKNLNKGESVGYSRRGVLARNSRIATIPIGYADGYNRKLGNGVGFVIINGKKAVTVGSICMDMTMVDVTDIDCNEGDEVMIFGEAPTIADIAVQMGTIPYEVLTTISRRVKRVYFQE
ncbi:MAG: bifunctional UDP-N-acetylmuramoyl-tripeptide:D-alanyl-D-alanine ligase/alanine racemase [Bacteroidota bacterium]